MRGKKKSEKTKRELPLIKVNIECLEDGMRAASDICNDYGTPIIRRMRKIESKHITQFRMAGIEIIDVWDEEHDEHNRKEQVPSIHIDDYPRHLSRLVNTNVLIVDDSKSARMVLRYLIEDTGLKVVAEAGGGREGIEKAREFKPTLITLDISMPDVDGLTALPDILSASPGSKVIMISSLGYKDRIVEALTLGAAQFVTKPFSHSGLQKVVINTIIGHKPV